MADQQITDVLPLSPLQEGLLFHAQYHDLDVYTVQLVVDVSGDLRTESLRRAVAAVLERHPNLRAGFWTTKGGEPVQFVPRSLPAPFAEHDVREHADALAERDRLTAAARD